MNCRPGQRAVIVTAAIPENIGRIVEVVEAIGVLPKRGNLSRSRQMWMCESLGSPLRYDIVLMDGEHRTERLAVGPVPDEFLRPLPDLDEPVVRPVEELTA